AAFPGLAFRIHIFALRTGSFPKRVNHFFDLVLPLFSPHGGEFVHLPAVGRAEVQESAVALRSPVIQVAPETCEEHNRRFPPGALATPAPWPPGCKCNPETTASPPRTESPTPATLAPG